MQYPSYRAACKDQRTTAAFLEHALAAIAGVERMDHIETLSNQIAIGADRFSLSKFFVALERASAVDWDADHASEEDLHNLVRSASQLHAARPWFNAGDYILGFERLPGAEDIPRCVEPELVEHSAELVADPTHTEPLRTVFVDRPRG